MEGVQQFRLRWNEHLPNFVSVFAHLLTSETLVDVTLTADGQQLQAHRIILSACSSYFQELFMSNPCRHPIVILKDVKFEDLLSVIHFIYYGEVKVSQNKFESVLKTAELLRIKGLSDFANRASVTKALFGQDLSSGSEQLEDCPLPRSPSTESSFEAPHTETSIEKPETHRKRRKLDSRFSGSSAESWEVTKADSLASPPPQNRDYVLLLEPEQQILSHSLSQDSGSRSREKLSSFTEQSSVESELCRSRQDEGEDSVQLKVSSAANGGSTGNATKKRNRPLFRQQCVKNENDQAGAAESETYHPGSRSRSPELTRSKSTLQVPTNTLPRQRSQPILPSQSSIVSGSPITPISFLPGNIPTVAVTPATTAPNIVIEQYPTILRVVSFEDMPTAHNAVSSGLVRSQSGTSSGRPTLQVPTSVEESSSASGRNLLKARIEENLKRSVSNPGLTTSPGSPNTSCSSSGHCPVSRSGAALGCNYCWNTVDESGRTLRRKTKYYCPDCQTNLCIVPCFQLYHEKSTNEATKPTSKNTSNAHQYLSKMSSI